LASDKETIGQKIRADIARWSRVRGKKPREPLFLLRLFLIEPGFQLAFSVRLREGARKIPALGKVIDWGLRYFGVVLLGSDIAPGADIGAGVYFPHPVGIVIGPEVKIGRNVSILQGVTMGRGEASVEAALFVGDGAWVMAGAKVFGAIKLGENSRIGANAVVLHDVPPGATAVGVPARIVRLGEAAAPK
jgi:serine O-acetyltransferase